MIESQFEFFTPWLCGIQSAREESDVPIQEVDEGNEGAFTRDWIEQMTASVSKYRGPSE